MVTYNVGPTVHACAGRHFSHSSVSSRIAAAVPPRRLVVVVGRSFSFHLIRHLVVTLRLQQRRGREEVEEAIGECPHLRLRERER